MNATRFLTICLATVFTLLSGCQGTTGESTPPAETDSTADTDSSSLVLPGRVCPQEVPIAISPVKRSLAILLERSQWFLQSTLSSTVFDAVGEFVHQMEDWAQMAFFVYPGGDCVDLTGTDPVVGCSVSDNLLFGFETENPGTVLDDKLLGWMGIGFCGIEAVVPALNRTLDYLNALPERAGSDVLLVAHSPAACDPTIPPAAPVEDCDCPAGREDDCAQSGLHCTVLTPLHDVATDYAAAQYSLHAATFSTDTQMDAWGRQIAQRANTEPNYYASDHTGVATQFDALRKRFYSCQFTVDWSSVPGAEGNSLKQGLINLFIDEQPVIQDQTCAGDHGWEWVGGDTIELCPATCDTLTQDNVISSVVFEASYGCASLVEAAE